MYQHKTSPCRRCSKSARPITTERSYRSDMKMLGTTDRVGWGAWPCPRCWLGLVVHWRRPQQISSVYSDTIRCVKDGPKGTCNATQNPC